MRIAFDIRPLFDGNAFRGTGTYVRNLLQNLLAIDRTNEYLLIHEPVKEFQSLPFADARVRYGRLPLFKPRFLSSREKWIWEYFHLSRLLRDEKVDLFHATAPVGPLKCGTPRVATCYDFIPLKYWDRGRSGLLSDARRRLRYRMALRSMRDADHLLAISAFTKDEAVRYLGVSPDKISVIPLGVSEAYRVRPDLIYYDELKLRLRLQDPIALYVGGADPRKNIPALIQAAAYLVRVRKLDFQLVIAGTPEASIPDIQRLCAETGKLDNVRVTGILAEEDLVTLYNHARLFCFPSLEEGFGLPVLEAMACGLPVIAYRNVAVEEIAGTDAKLVADMEGAFYSAFEELLLNDGVWEDYRKQGLIRAGRFTWKKTAEETLDAYERIATR
ncbi:MAG: glycosyltransferase family 1 protein [Fibrobacterota bacterium]